MPEGDVTLVNVFGEFREFKGAMSARMDSLDHELRVGIMSIKSSLDRADGKNDDHMKRLALLESKQALIYRILAAVGLATLGIGAELVRRALMGG